MASIFAPLVMGAAITEQLTSLHHLQAAASLPDEEGTIDLRSLYDQQASHIRSLHFLSSLGFNAVPINRLGRSVG